jgi:hypothetical protein
MTISTNRTVYIDLEAKRNDYFYLPFAVKDDSDHFENFSGYTSAKLTIRTTENSSTEIVSFTSTGSTYVIDISGRANGSFIVSCDQLAFDAGQYQYDFEVRTSTRRKTVLSGKFTIISDITR